MENIMDVDSAAMRMPFSLLRQITNSFSEERLIGKGILMEINHPDKIGIHVKLINRESYRVEKKLL
jgi:hypothetical protein